MTQGFETRINGELRFDVPHVWPSAPMAAIELEQRVRTLAQLIAAVPFEALSVGAGRQVVLECVTGFEALWPVATSRPLEVAAAIRIVRDGFGDAAG